jgi:uncharacterized membrane protein (DUF4010 family)
MATSSALLTTLAIAGLAAIITPNNPGTQFGRIGIWVRRGAMMVAIVCLIGLLQAWLHRR